MWKGDHDVKRLKRFPRYPLDHRTALDALERYECEFEVYRDGCAGRMRLE